MCLLPDFNSDPATFLDQEVVEPLSQMGFGDRLETCVYAKKDGAPHNSFRIIVSPSAVPADAPNKFTRQASSMRYADESPRKASLLVIGAPDRDVAELLESLEPLRGKLSWALARVGAISSNELIAFVASAPPHRRPSGRAATRGRAHARRAKGPKGRARDLSRLDLA